MTRAVGYLWLRHALECLLSILKCLIPSLDVLPEVQSFLIFREVVDVHAFNNEPEKLKPRRLLLFL